MAKVKKVNIAVTYCQPQAFWLFKYLPDCELGQGLPDAGPPVEG
jgi:hypothetical protein